MQIAVCLTRASGEYINPTLNRLSSFLPSLLGDGAPYFRIHPRCFALSSQTRLYVPSLERLAASPPARLLACRSVGRAATSLSALQSLDWLKKIVKFN